MLFVKTNSNNHVLVEYWVKRALSDNLLYAMANQTGPAHSVNVRPWRTPVGFYERSLAEKSFHRKSGSCRYCVACRKLESSANGLFLTISHSISDRGIVFGTAPFVENEMISALNRT
jgi:hypothetical protein